MASWTSSSTAGVSTERARQIEERALKRLSQRPELMALREAA